MVDKTETISTDEHVKIQEAIVPGPHHQQAVILSLEEDVCIQEKIKENDMTGGSTYSTPLRDLPQASDFAASSSGSSHHHLEQKS